MSASPPPYPGGIGITHLKVYDTEAPDGLHGGSAHVHFACTEAYVVVGGRGTVQSLGPDGYRELPLEKGGIVWFTPGLIHRLVNLDGELEIVVPMQNAGLPESGDFVLCFPEEILRDKDAYFAAASLASSGHVYASGIDAAYRRRDLAVEGFHALNARYASEGISALERFYSLALPLVAPKLGSWRGIWERGPLRATTETGEQLIALGEGDVSHLLRGTVNYMPPPAERKLGMCGTLGTYLPEGILL